MAVAKGEYRLQTTQTQMILELWAGDRKVIVYMDLDAQDGVEKSEAYQIEETKAGIDDPVTVVPALRWLANPSGQQETQHDLDDVP